MAIQRATRPIGAKLVGIISALLLLSLGAITLLVSVMVSADVRITAEDNNFTINLRSASEAETAMETLQSETLLLLDTLDAVSRPVLQAGTEAGSGPAQTAAALFFRRNPDVAAIVPVAWNGASLVNEDFFAANGLEPAGIAGFIRSEAAGAESSGEIFLRNAGPAFGLPLLALFFPRGDGARLVLFSPNPWRGPSERGPIFHSS